MFYLNTNTKEIENPYEIYLILKPAKYIKYKEEQYAASRRFIAINYILKTLSFFKIQLPLAVSDKYCQKDDNQNRS